MKRFFLLVVVLYLLYSIAGAVKNILQPANNDLPTIQNPWIRAGTG